jgi:hypothetical protein
MTDCIYCGEPVLKVEESAAGQKNLHRECVFRAVAGSVAHIQHRCGCYVPGSTEGDPPGMTIRQAAKASLEAQLAKERRVEMVRDN